MTAPNNTSSLWRCSSNSPARAEDDRYQPLLSEASGLLETAIAEIRRLAHGIYPPLLVSGGLTEALPAVAARAPVPVKINLQGLRRYPASIEAALYFCCSEALQNAAKHGGPGTTVTITTRADDRMLTLTISDTGRGFDPATEGTGLTNMTDRLSAIGGHLAIHTAPGRGTRVTASIATPVQEGWPEPPEKCSTASWSALQARPAELLLESSAADRKISRMTAAECRVDRVQREYAPNGRCQVLDRRLHTARTVTRLVAPRRLQGRLVLPGWVVAVPTLSGLVPTERRVCR